MKKTSVLFIGNQKIFTENFRGKLEVGPFFWRQSGTFSTALSSIRKNPVDVVLLFNGSTKGSVQSNLISLRQKYPNIPVIIASVNVSLMEAVEAMKKGAYDYFTPPFNNELIVSAIQKGFKEFKTQHVAHFSSDMLSMLMENVPDIIYSLNPNGEFISVSPAVENTLGYQQAELLGKSVFDIIHPDDRERILTGFRESVEQGDQSVSTLQFRMKTKRGDVRDFEISRKLYFEGGKVVRNDGIARDVSHRKYLERELWKYSEDLEDRVKERTEKIEYAKSQLQALNQVSNSFAQIFEEDALLEEAPKLLTESLDFDQAAIILKQEDKWLLKSYCFGEESPDLLKKYLDQMNKGKIPPSPYLEKCLTQNEAILIDNLEDLPGWSPEMSQSYQVKSLVAAPIRVRGETIGIIEGDMVFHRRAMDSQDVARFEMFANMVGLALNNIRAYQDLEKRVLERTESLNEVNKHLSLKAKEHQKASMDLAKANVTLLNIQEELQDKNEQMQKLITEISQNKDILQSILDSNMSAILMVDKNNKIVAVNRMIEILFELIPDKLIGSYFTTFINGIKSRFKNSNKFTKLINTLIENPQDTIEEET
jgi:PAS domain S-box-containing protein